jgi:hypothetical protein
MSFSETKLIDLNLFFHVRDNILLSPLSAGISFAEEVELDPLTKVDFAPLGYTVASKRAWQGTNRNWAYDLPGVIVPRFPIEAKKNGIDVLAPGDFTVNYKDGMILLSSAYAATLDETDEITSDYFYSTVEVRDGYPHDLEGQPNAQVNLPVVAVEYENRVPIPFELGGTREHRRMYSIHVLATSDSERDDLVGIIAKELEEQTIPIIDYRLGLPLTFAGELNPLFTPVLVPDQSIRFADVRDRVIRQPGADRVHQHWGVVNVAALSFI